MLGVCKGCLYCYPQEEKSTLEMECTKTIEELQERTRRTLQRGLDPMAAMKMIDTLQWLGISYHYAEEISFWLDKLQHWDASEAGLHAIALRFRLLRQNARPVTSGNSNLFRIVTSFVS